MMFRAIMFKTLKDMFSIRRSILFLIAVLIVPLIGSAIFNEAGQIANMTLAMQDQMIVGFFIIISFIWIAGIPIVMLAGVTCGDFISKEDEDGTLLLLVSKPVRRYEIILGKFLAFMLSAMLLEAISLLLSALLLSGVLEIDIYIFNNILGLIPQLFLYSVFVSFIFGAIATALSSIFKSRIKTILTIVAITMLIFFGFMVARGWLGTVYEDYYLNYMDVNYHLGNSYLLFVESSGYRIAPTYQGIMGMFTGTYDAADISKLYDMDIGALPPTLVAKDYTTPLQSTLIWTGIAVMLLLIGILKFERREVS